LIERFPGILLELLREIRPRRRIAAVSSDPAHPSPLTGR
jgi:hypothetical protein